MNSKPIEEASHPDLRNSLLALQRAAQRARDVAAQTGTAIIVQVGNEIKHIAPGEKNKRPAE